MQVYKQSLGFTVSQMGLIKNQADAAPKAEAQLS